MPWVRFIEDFDWQAAPKVVVFYRATTIHLVRQVCADKAVKEGKAIFIERPKKAEADASG